MTTIETPEVVDRETWLAAREALLPREKAHTHEGDAIAAARRRLPMTEVPNVELVGDNGPTHLLDIFEGRDQLIVYFVTYDTTGRGVEAIMGSLKLLDMTAYGRQEVWEDSPEGWPQRPTYSSWRRNGRPTAQWTRRDARACGSQARSVKFPSPTAVGMLGGQVDSRPTTVTSIRRGPRRRRRTHPCSGLGQATPSDDQFVRVASPPSRRHRSTPNAVFTGAAMFTSTKSTPVTVRLATPVDAETVRSLIGELAAHQNQSDDVIGDVTTWRALLARPEVIILLAELDEQPVGYVSAVRRLHLWTADDVVALDDLYVRDGHRDRGVGLTSPARAQGPSGLSRFQVLSALRVDDDAGRIRQHSVMAATEDGAEDGSVTTKATALPIEHDWACRIPEQAAHDLPVGEGGQRVTHTLLERRQG